jgi:hypothetical protein
MKHRSNDILSTVKIFHKMHELGIKPLVVTFSAILNVCRSVSVSFPLSVTRCPVRILFLYDASKRKTSCMQGCVPLLNKYFLEG